MKYSFTKVLILRPKACLLKLINYQLPNYDWQFASHQALSLTAYILPTFKNDEDMLHNLEVHFLQIFQNEIAKIIGTKSAKNLQLSFFEFLSCFKFEWYDNTNFIYKNFSTKLFIYPKYKKIPLNLDSAITLENLCEALAKLENCAQIIAVKDLRGNDWWRQFISKISLVKSFVSKNIFGEKSQKRFRFRMHMS